MFVDEVLVCIEASDGEDESVRANEFGLKLIKVWCRLERKRKKRKGDEYERNDKKDDGDNSKVSVKNRLMLFGKWFWMFWFRLLFGLIWFRDSL